MGDLIDNGTRSWKVEFIMDNFSDCDCKRILNIPSSKFQHNDYQVWRGEGSKEFSVCSAYNFLLQNPIEATHLYN